MKLECYVCSKEFDSIRKLGNHLSRMHKINKQEYKLVLMGIYPGLFDNCKNCGIKIPKYFSDGGSRCCSKECSYQLLKNKNKGRLQSKETIKKRVLNTDQKKKEETRQKTMIEKYDAIYYFSNSKERNEKISKSLINKIHAKEHSSKIVESKRKNGTLKQKTDTKKQISDSLKQYYANDDIDHCITLPKEGKGGEDIVMVIITTFITDLVMN